MFKYTLSGSLQGSWTIDSRNSSPTGITLDPSNPGTLWIVDNVEGCGDIMVCEPFSQGLRTDVEPLCPLDDGEPLAIMLEDAPLAFATQAPGAVCRGEGLTFVGSPQAMERAGTLANAGEERLEFRKTRVLFDPAHPDLILRRAGFKRSSTAHAAATASRHPGAQVVPRRG